MAGEKTTLPPEEEEKFQRWYKEWANRLGINPDPDDPKHYYDYRGAYLAGEKPGPDNHWSSKFKLEGHPRMIVDGVNTKTGEPMTGEPITRQQMAGNLQQIDPVKLQAQEQIEVRATGDGKPLTPEDRRKLPVQVAAMEEAKNEKAQGIPDRQAYEADLRRGNDAIAQEKIRLRQQMQEGVPLTRGQKVAFALMTIGVAVAGATKGKRGMAAAGSAISGAADKVEKNQLLAETAQNAILKPQLSALNAQEKLNNTALMRSAEAPIKNQENRELSLVKKLDAEAAGVGPKGDTTTNVFEGPSKFTADQTNRLAAAGSLGQKGESLIERIKTLPPGRIKFQLGKEFSATEAGKVYADVRLFVKNIMKSIEGGRPSDFDAKTYLNILSGDFTASPEDMAELIQQGVNTINEMAAGTIETTVNLGKSPEGMAAEFRNRIKPVGKKKIKQEGQDEAFQEAKKLAGADSSNNSSLADQYKSGQITKKQYLDMRSKELMGGV